MSQGSGGGLFPAIAEVPCWGRIYYLSPPPNKKQGQGVRTRSDRLPSTNQAVGFST